ncbi:glucosaminidase domain-containing protein [Acidaminococcus intestini]|nr:glucosaminidase domain-containing protein [Acidaminococcus intestini]
MKPPKGAVVFIYGAPMDIPQTEPPLVRRQRAMAHRVVTDPNLLVISKRLMTQGQIWKIPENYDKVSIFGEPEVRRSQAIALLTLYNPQLPIKATPEEIVDAYYEEASREGIRWDLAFSQALLETGFFAFGGTVVPEQNNFCGLGTTSATVRGAYFPTPKDGVRAHIQHLMAYTTDRLPKTAIIDPRYDLVHRIKKETGYATTWKQLNGKWATGSYYAEKIMNIHEQMKGMIAIMGTD